MLFIKRGMINLSISVIYGRKGPIVESVVGFEHLFFRVELPFEIGDDNFVLDQDFIAPVNKVIFLHEFGLEVNIFWDGAGGVDFLN